MPETDLDTELGVNPHLHVFSCGDDEIRIKHGARSRFTRLVRDDGRTRLLGRVIQALRVPSTLRAVRDAGVFRADETDSALGLVDYLRREQVLVEPSRDLWRAYSDAILGGGADLSKLTIGLLGAGPLGARLARSLATLQVGRLILHDDRPSSGADHLFSDLAPTVDRGTGSCVEALAADLAARGFQRAEARALALDDAGALTGLAGESDFLIAAFETFAPRALHAINDIANASGRPWISVYVDGSEAVIGPLYVPSETCCYNEFEIQHESSLGSDRSGYLLYKEVAARWHRDAPPPVLPPFLDMTSGLAMTGILRFLLAGRSPLVGRSWRVDFERLSIDYEEVLRLPRCPACLPHRPPLRQPFM